MEKNYIYHEATISICPDCLEQIPAKIVFKDNKVFLIKTCPVHGKTTELFEEDIEYYLDKRSFDKPGTISEYQTVTGHGCPFDCGLCPDHDQHTCIGLIEVTNSCDLNCPTCYAESGKGGFLPLKRISRMLDFFVKSEKKDAEILQISGGEPATHPDIIEIIELARKKNIKYVMLNTNGLRIAKEEGFARELSKFEGEFEVYLQFDGFRPETYSRLRGKNLSRIKLQAIEYLKKYNIPITLVTTVEKGVNDNEIGKIIQFAIKTEGIRGVNFQPVAYFGRVKEVDTANRLTLSGIIRRIEQQAPDLFRKGDIVPLPCNVERVAVTYMTRSKNGKFIPLTRDIKFKNYLPFIDNTFAFDVTKVLEDSTKELCDDAGCCSCMQFATDISKNFPLDFMLKTKKEKKEYIDKNTFRVSITSFIDIYNFDIKSMQKECVHVITPDLLKIPFSSYNMFYRK